MFQHEVVIEKPAWRHYNRKQEREAQRGGIETSAWLSALLMTITAAIWNSDKERSMECWFLVIATATCPTQKQNEADVTCLSQLCPLLAFRGIFQSMWFWYTYSTNVTGLTSEPKRGNKRGGGSEPKTSKDSMRGSEQRLPVSSSVVTQECHVKNHVFLLI